MSETRKRILVMIDWYLPGFRGGGPITSVANLVDALGDSYDFSIVTSDTDYGQSKPYVGIETDQWLALGPHLRIWYCSRAANGYRDFRKLIGETDYDLLYLNSMFSLRYTIYPLWSSRAAHPDREVLLAPRGMLHAGALGLKPLKKKIFLKAILLMGIHRHIRFQATDDQEVLDIRQVFGAETKVLQAPNLPRLHQPPFVSIPKERGKLKLVFLSRLTEKKGLHTLLQMLQSQQGEISLEVVGPDEEAGYWQRCAAIIAQLPANIQVTKSPPLPPEEAFEKLQSAHCFAMPTLGENFGHAIFEALRAGRPVLISDKSPWRELERQKVGFDIPLDKTGLFEQAISQLVAFDQFQWEEWARASWGFAATYVGGGGLVAENRALLEEAMLPIHTNISHNEG